MKRLARDEKGQALIITLLLLVIGSIIITPTLNFMGTGIKAGRTYEQKIDEIYAADSGVEDALWHIRNNDEQDVIIKNLLGEAYDEYDYSTAYDYPYDLSVNDKDVAVSIQNIWIPKDISTPTPSEAEQIIEDETLIIVGYPSSTANTYTIKIVYNWDTTAHRDALKVKKIGIWLSPGFEYTEYSGSCSLQSQAWYSAPAISLYKGGQAVVWTFASQPTLKSFTVGKNDPYIEKTFTFKYTSPEQGKIPELVSSWVDTTGVSGVTYSWDDSIRLYKIESQAGDVEIQAYGAKTKFRKLKSTISADYTVAGNTWMKATATSGNDRYARNRLYAEKTSTVQRISLQSIPESGIVPAGKIPEEAIIDNVYLYWSGWIDYHYWYKVGNYYYWGTIQDLMYGYRTDAQLIANSKVGDIKFTVGGSSQIITADRWQIDRTEDCADAQYAWDYACYKDVTELTVSGNVTVREYVENAMKSAGSGTVTFAAGHADAVRNLHRPESSPAGAYANYYFALYNENDTPTGQYTGYPLSTPAHKRPDRTGYEYDTKYQYAYSGWSLIIFYRTPGLVQRQLYLYDLVPEHNKQGISYFQQVSAWGWPATVTIDITGFLAPPSISEVDKSHVTYFAGEGDNHYTGDYIRVNDISLCYPPTAPDGPCNSDNPVNNVFNSKSNALPTLSTDGVDMDTFILPGNCILPYSTSATVKLISSGSPLAEMYTLVYLVLSFRSELTTGGIITNYSVKIS